MVRLGILGVLIAASLVWGAVALASPWTDTESASGTVTAACSFPGFEEDVCPPSQGDVNCDNVVDVVDALFILQYEVGLRVDSAGCPLPPSPPDTLDAAPGDVNKDGLTNVVDALFILQCEVGIPNSFCP